MNASSIRALSRLFASGLVNNQSSHSSAASLALRGLTSRPSNHILRFSHLPAWPLLSNQQLNRRHYLQHLLAAASGGISYCRASPYFRLLPSLSWSTINAFIHRTTSSSWVPSLTGVLPYCHVPLLSALNLVNTSLPTTFALVFLEVVRSTREARAQSFDFYGAGQMDQMEQMAKAAGAASLALALGSHWMTGLVWRLRSKASEIMGGFWHVMRVAWLMLIFLPVAASCPLAINLGFRRSEWMELLRRTLETGGAFFIKWGQWAATRHDMFPPDMCQELAQLQIAAPAHSFAKTRKVVEEALGMKLEEVFESIDQVPVASGSIGQIHRAKLSKKGSQVTGCCREGQVVAVKVRHPGTAEALLHDFETMLFIASVAEKTPILKHLRLADTLKQFAAPLKEQIDLAREASNLQRFNYNFRDNDSVKFPVPLYPLVSADVLVESFEEGEHITQYIDSPEPSHHNTRLSELGSSTVLQMMLRDNLIHSDLHPGNILVRLLPPTGLFYGFMNQSLEKIKPWVGNNTRARIHNLQQKWLAPQMVLLDVGMATEMTDQDQVNMLGLFRSFSNMDGRTCAEWTLRFSGLQQSCPDPEGFKDALEEAFEVLKKASMKDPALTEELGLDLDAAARGAEMPSSSSSQAPSSSEGEFKSTAEALSNVLELIRIHQVSLPGHICAVVVTTLVLEGWSNKLDPNHSVLQQVQRLFDREIPVSELIMRSMRRTLGKDFTSGMAAVC